MGFDITTLGFPCVPGRGAGLQDSFPSFVFNDFSANGNLSRRHRQLQHLSLCRHEQRLQCDPHEGRGQAQTHYRLGIYEEVSECRPAALALRRYTFDPPLRPSSPRARQGAAATSLRSCSAWEIPGRKNTDNGTPISRKIFSPQKPARTTRPLSRILTIPTTNLTITAGPRWDIFGGKTERHNRLEYFDPTATELSGRAVAPSPAGKYSPSSGHRSAFTTNLNDFGPRLGFSWQPAITWSFAAEQDSITDPARRWSAVPILNSDGFSTSNNWNATCTQPDGNTVINGPHAHRDGSRRV